MALDLRPLHPDFGVEVRGLDLKAADEAAMAQVMAAYYRHSLLLFRDQDLGAADQAAVSRRFGAVKPAMTIRHPIPEVPEISRIGNLMEDGRPTAFLNRQGVEWHSDAAGASRKDMATFLYALEVPDVGGDTMFCSMHAAYATLPLDLRDRIAGRQVLHSFLQHNDKVLRLSPGAFPPMTQAERARFPDMWDDLVGVHPATDRPYYFISINLVRSITDLDEAESMALTEALVAHATEPTRVYRHRYRPGDLVVWDNRALMHSATDVDEYDGTRRLMHRSSANTDPIAWRSRHLSAA